MLTKTQPLPLKCRLHEARTLSNMFITESPVPGSQQVMICISLMNSQHLMLDEDNNTQKKRLIFLSYNISVFERGIIFISDSCFPTASVVQ